MKECIKSGNKNREIAGKGFLKRLPEILDGFDSEGYLEWNKTSGIGATPLLELPKGIIPYHNIRVRLKLEYLNFGESVKARPFGAIHFNNMILRHKSNARLAATSGNFGLSGSYILNGDGEFSVYMSRKTVTENKNLIKKLEANGVKIETFSDDYCPAAGGKRGQAIAAARLMETEFDYDNYDQYGDLMNPLAHYLTTGPEIYGATEGKITVFLTALGTCGSIVGTGHYLKQKVDGIKVIGAIPFEGHHQVGLRSENELGATFFFEEAKKICDNIICVKDEDAYSNMIKLWEAGIPAGVTCGTNLSAALQFAEEAEREGREEDLVLLAPDSLENYKEFLTLHLPGILGVEFDRYSDLFEGLREKVIEERARHFELSKSLASK